MPGEDIHSWSTTALSNGNADTLINWVEGQQRASVNNSARGMMAAHAKNRNLLNGSIVTTGTPNAQAFLSGVTYTAIPTGMMVKLKVGAGLTSTAAATLNMDGIGDVAIVTSNGANLFGGELIAGAYIDLLYNGTNWVFLYSQQFIDEQLHAGGGIIIGQQIFDTAGSFSYQPTLGTETCIIECIGGGGAGGGATAVPSTVLGGGGGGSGGYSRVLKSATDIGGLQTVTVGAGGVGSTGDGTAGGDTSVGTLCVAKGGEGGGRGISSVFIHSGNGGAPGTGDITAAGAPGGPGQYGGSALYLTSSGEGGSGPFGGGALGSQIAGSGSLGTGIDARNYGSGGSGANVYDHDTQPGGSGSSGLVIITEYAGRGAPGANGATGPIGPAGPAGTGTGDVLVTGTPVAGQVAVWSDTSHIRGVDGFAPTTGDVKITLKTVADPGWVLADDGSIGDALSGATTRANADTQALFVLLWTNIIALVVQDSAGVTVSRGVSAAADYGAHRRLVLPKTLGRVLGIAGTGAGLTARTLGATVGAETETQTVAKMASHTHTDLGHTHATPKGSTVVTVGSDVTAVTITAANFTDPTASGYASLTSAGGGTPLDIMQPTSFLNLMIKL